MDFDYTPEENAFREEVRSFIQENLPPKNSAIRISSIPGWKKFVQKAG